MFISNCRGQSTAVLPARCSRTVCTTTECRRSRMFRLAEQRCCICASDVTAATAASASSRKTPFCPGIIVPPAVWLPRSSTRSVKLYLPQKSAHSLTFPAQPQCGISSMSRSSQPSSPRFFLLMSLREIPAAKSTTVSS